MRGPARELKGNRQSEGDSGEFVCAFMDGRPQGRARMRTTPSKPCVREMFAPEMAAGLVQPFDPAGYRNAPVYIRRRLVAEYTRLDAAINPPM